MSVAEACETLVEALEARRTDILKSLLDHLSCGEAADVDIDDVLANLCNDNGTLLHKAVVGGDRDAVRALLMTGADPGLHNHQGETPLDLVTSIAVSQTFSDEFLRAVANSDEDRVMKLIAAGLGKNCVDSEDTGNTALHWAASFATENMMKLLVNNAICNVDIVNKNGCTALHDAVSRGHEAIAKILLDAGANPDFAATNGKLEGKTPRKLAANKTELSQLFSTPTPVVNGVNDETLVDTNNITSDEIKQIPDDNILPENSPLHQLWPTPRHILVLKNAQPLQISSILNLTVVAPMSPYTIHTIMDVFKTHSQEFTEAGRSISFNKDVAGEDIEIGLSKELSQEEYNIAITAAKIRILAGGLAGLHYAIYTFLQILKLYPKDQTIPALVIKDAPALPVRAVLLDLANYGRLPTLETLSSTIITLSRLKINQVHLYIRLSSHATNWQLPYSEEELINLDRLCIDREIEVQSAIDIIQPCSPTVLSQYTSIFSKILSCFSFKKSVHLGPCLSSVLLSNPKLLDTSHSLLGLDPTSTIYLCGTSFPGEMNSASLAIGLGLIEYGFKGNYPWDGICNERSATGLPLLLCPGTAAWECLLGRPDTMKSNVTAAARAAHRSGARGLVVAHWASSPALAPLSGAFPGWILGTGLAWGLQSSKCDLGAVLTRYVLDDSVGNAGQVLLELGQVESTSSQSASDILLQPSFLLNVITNPTAVDLSTKEAEYCNRAIAELRRSLSRLQVSRENGGGTQEGQIQEITLSGELLLLATRLARALMLTPDRKLAQLQPTFRTDLANKLLSLTEQYRAVWLSRYQPGGMQSSLLHLSDLLTVLQPDIDNFKV